MLSKYYKYVSIVVKNVIFYKTIIPTIPPQAPFVGRVSSIPPTSKELYFSSIKLHLTMDHCIKIKEMILKVTTTSNIFLMYDGNTFRLRRPRLQVLLDSAYGQTSDHPVQDYFSNKHTHTNLQYMYG